VPDISGLKNEGGKITFDPCVRWQCLRQRGNPDAGEVVSVRQASFPAAEPSGGNSPSKTWPWPSPMRRGAPRRFVYAGSRQERATGLGEAKVIVSAGAPQERFLPKCSIRWPTCSGCRRCKPRGVRRS